MSRYIDARSPDTTTCPGNIRHVLIVLQQIDSQEVYAREKTHDT